MIRTDVFTLFMMGKVLSTFEEDEEIEWKKNSMEIVSQLAKFRFELRQNGILIKNFRYYRRLLKLNNSSANLLSFVQ